ncbi:MAG: hypothetical protein MAG795_00982 [Candidatus Woesearchaeota archaeon]|nr:hypothetical protein [Candidatus Woesearchaeota archaeon]
MKIKNFLEEKNYLVLIILALSMLSLTFIIRMIQSQPILIGEQAYSNLIQAQSLGPQINEPYVFLISNLGRIIGLYAASIVVALIFCLGSAALLFAFCEKLTNTYEAWIISLIFISSPAFIFMFVFSSAYSLYIFLILLAGYLLSCNKKAKIAAGVILMFLSLQGLILLLLISLILVYYLIKSENKRGYAFLLAIVLFLGVVSNYYIEPEPRILLQDIFTDSVTDFGALLGLGVFNIFLALLGIFSTWKNKKKYGLLHGFVLVLILVMILYKINLSVYLNLIFSFFAAKGLINFVKKKWQLKILKELTVLLVICGLLFSSFSYIKRVSSKYPDQDTIKALKKLNDFEKGIVLSHDSNYPLIKYYTGFSVFEQKDISEQIFQSRDYYKTTQMLNSSNITYILVDNRMKQNLVWNKEEQGLLFLFRNNQTFHKIIDMQAVQVWEFIPLNISIEV